MLNLDISNSQGDQQTVWDIESSRYRVVVCISCLPRDQDICSRYQKVRDTEYSEYRESTVNVSQDHAYTSDTDFL